MFQPLSGSFCMMALWLVLALLTPGTWGQLGDRRYPLDLPRHEGRVQHRDNHHNNYTQTGLVITDSENNNVARPYVDDDYSEADYEYERDVILRPVDATFQGCRDHANDASFPAYLNLTQMARIHNLTTKPEACHEYCLMKFPFSRFISLMEAQRNSADFCGCHEDMDVSQLVSCSDNYKIYCGPRNVDCRSTATTLQQLTLIVPIILTFILT